MIRTVVAAASTAAIVVAAIVPALAAIVIEPVMPPFPAIVEPIVPALAAIVIEPIVPYVVGDLMLTLLMVGRIVAAALCLSDGRYRDGAGCGERYQRFRVARVHLWSPPLGVAM
jgi:hypothetical protein